MSRVFPVSARVSARVSTIKEKTPRGTRDTDHFFPHPRATELLSSPWHPLSDLATQPIRRPDRTPLARLGPLAPCATEPLTGDLDSVGSVDFFFPCFLCCHFGSFFFPCFLCLPLWQLLVFLVSCAASLGSLFLYASLGSVFFLSVVGCVIRVVYGIWLRVWTHVRVRGWIGRKLATCVDACHVAS